MMKIYKKMFSRKYDLLFMELFYSQTFLLFLFIC